MFTLVITVIRHTKHNVGDMESSDAIVDDIRKAFTARNRNLFPGCDEYLICDEDYVEKQGNVGVSKSELFWSEVETEDPKYYSHRKSILRNLLIS
jgi:hypothetical protein